MSTSRSSVESRNAPKRVEMRCSRATIPSTRSKRPPARIRSPPVANQPRANAPAATSETRQPATVRRLWFTGRRNRNGSAAFTIASRRVPSFALITCGPSRSRGVGTLVRALRALLDDERDGLRGHVGQRRERALQILPRDVPAPPDQAAVEPQPLLRLPVHAWILLPGWGKSLAN